MTKQILMVALVALAGLVGNADAGVRGGRFAGTLQFESSGGPIDVQADFARFGNGFADTTFISVESPPAPGSYTETDLFIISFWNATYDAPFEPGEASGVCFFGLISTYNIVNAGNHSPDASGIVFRQGRAQLP